MMKFYIYGFIFFIVSLCLHFASYEFLNYEFHPDAKEKTYEDIPIHLSFDKPPSPTEEEKPVKFEEKKPIPKLKNFGVKSSPKKANIKPQFGISPQTKTNANALAVPIGNTQMIPDSGERSDTVQDLPESENLSSQAQLDRSSIEIPEYTEDALNLKVEGTYVVDVYIDESGVVRKAELKNRIGYGMDERLIVSAKKAKFSPAKDKFGKSIAEWTQIKFRLELP